MVALSGDMTPNRGWCEDFDTDGHTLPSNRKPNWVRRL
tara:strand:- start:2146 stop:2259 length:114 start_codon:yes stop_codon:yes gene_type:complete